MIIDGKAFRDWLGNVPGLLGKNTITALRRTSEAAATYARLSSLYKNHTYRLRASIKPSVPDATHAIVTANAPYAYFVEHGTPRHDIHPRRAKMLRFEWGGTMIFRRHVVHPGTKPRPFMAEAQRKATPLFSRLVAEAARDSFK